MDHLKLRVIELEGAARALFALMLLLRAKPEPGMPESAARVCGEATRFRARERAAARAIVRVLRDLVRGDRVEAIRARWGWHVRMHEGLDEDLRLLEKEMNRSEFRHADGTEADRGMALEVRHEPASRCFVLGHSGSFVHAAVLAVERYSSLLATDRRLARHAPIAVCPNCDGVFLKSRRGHGFCSSGCRLASWAKKKGKKYFAEAQRRRRAAAKRRTRRSEKRGAKRRANSRKVREGTEARNRHL